MYEHLFTLEQKLLTTSTEAPTQVTASNFKAHKISADAILITYQTVRAETDGSLFKALRSSVWTSNGTDWQIFFHQGTQLAENL